MPTILLKKSDTASAVPTTANLTNLAGGVEVAVNTADRRMFTMTSASAVVELGTNPSSLTLTGGTANGVLYLNASKAVTSGSALVFDGTNLGIGTTSPAAKLEISASFANSAVEEIARISRTGGTSAYGTPRAAALTFFDASGSTLTAAVAGVRDNAAGNFLGGLSFYTASNVSFPRTTVADLTQQMVLTSSGNLGIGTTSPAAKLDVAGTVRSNNALAFEMTGSASLRQTASGGAMYFDVGAGGSHGDFIWRSSSSFTTRMTLDSSGNLGLGVTPSAWATLKPIEIGYIGNAFSGYINDVGIYATSNAYYNGGWKYAASSKLATRYSAEAGVHSWSYAASGTAGNAITFTQAMTLDASGNLGVGITSPSSRLHVSAGSGSGAAVFATVGNTAGGAQLGVNTGGAVVLGAFATNNILFGYNNSTTFVETARITSTGNFLVGTTTDVSGRSGVISDVAGNVRAIPRTGSAKTSVYTLSISDVGQFVELGTGGGIDVPNGVFSTGDVVSVFNNTTGARTISLTITTAYIAGTDADKNSVTLATRGLATILFISNSVCVVSGNVS